MQQLIGSIVNQKEVKHIIDSIVSVFDNHVDIEDDAPKIDLSVWKEDEYGNEVEPIYLETIEVSECQMEFRMDYRKVVLCINTATSGLQILSCRKMAKLLVRKWDLNKSYHAMTREERTFNQTICGYLENLLQQNESKYQIYPIYRSL